MGCSKCALVSLLCHSFHPVFLPLSLSLLYPFAPSLSLLSLFLQGRVSLFSPSPIAHTHLHTPSARRAFPCFSPSPIAFPIASAPVRVGASRGLCFRFASLGGAVTAVTPCFGSSFSSFAALHLWSTDLQQVKYKIQTSFWLHHYSTNLQQGSENAAEKISGFCV